MNRRHSASLISAVFLLTTLTLMPGSLIGAAPQAIHEDFKSNSFDSWNFRAEENKSGGHWDLTGTGLRAILPTGAKGRPPLKFVGLVQLEGDFRVSARYTITKLPLVKPGSYRNNIEIYLSNPNGFASVFRTAEATHSVGFHVHHPGPADTKDVYQLLSTKSTSGRLEVRRVGDTLHFSASDVDGTSTEFGSAPFDGQPITHLAFQALAYESTDGLDIRFDDLDVEAEKIIPLIERPSNGPNAWTVIVRVVVIIAVGAAIYAWRRSRTGPDVAKAGGEPCDHVADSP